MSPKEQDVPKKGQADSRGGSTQQYSRRDSKFSQAVGSCPKTLQLGYVPSAGGEPHSRVIPGRSLDALGLENSGRASVTSTRVRTSQLHRMSAVCCRKASCEP